MLDHLTAILDATPEPLPTLGFLNSYLCPECNHWWQDEWTAQVDDDCPRCGHRHVSPCHSEDLTEEDL